MQVPNQQSYIPSEAYLFFPKADSARRPGTQRIFFDGNTQYTVQEHQMIKKFRSYAAKEHYSLKPMWTDNMILRFLCANNFKMRKTLSSVKEHTTWRETRLPVRVDQSLQQILNSGLLYVHGRDQEFRPIMIFNVYMIDPKRVDLDLITRALTFWFEYVLNEWMLPGQVENWVFIADVKGMSTGTLMLPAIRQLFAYLQNNYKCRLHQLYVLNVPSTLSAPWKVVKKFLDEVTIQKIKICSGSQPTGLLNSTNPEQVEQKYGGSARNATQYWPPIIPSNNYFVSQRDAQALITEEQYINLYQTGALKNMRVDQSRINKYSAQQPKQPNTQASQSISPNTQAFQPVSSVDSPNRLGSPSSPSSPDSQTSSSSSTSSSASSGLESNSDLDDSIVDEEDMDDINEMTERGKINLVRREFQSSFLQDIYSH